ncbi:hypothetical protein HPB52_011843 [Rhipicephalus sanguineus]|uniref:exodeoxyribonuclease III n=1 Tax=Rhipicephalus sanguineus TaxID=34632 RepID=A0A9D4T0K3_RHISA|nr:hypothetical protein HPB52_011843 [Rhipicephalus sanguineus]
MASLSLTIASFNCRGLSRVAKQNEVIELARARKVDILVLQETYVYRLSQIKSFDATFHTRSYWSFGASGSRGVAIILMPRFTGSVLRYSRDSDGRLLWMDLDSGIRIVNIYAPNQFRAQKDFFAALDNHLVGPSRVVLVGDFNCVLDCNDRQTHRGTAPKWTDRRGEKVLRELVDELGLVDAWRTLRPGLSGMTWTGRSARSRIDRFYVSPSLAPSMHSSWLVSSAVSDHRLLILRFAGTNLVAQGKRPWRLNARLLKDQEIIDDVASFIHRMVHPSAELDGDKWDEVKAGAAECFRTWGKLRAKEERAEIKIISDAILLLSRPESCGPGIAPALTTLRKELRVALQRRWDGLKAVARAERWEMEACGSCVYVGRQVAKLPRDKGGLGIPDLGLMANALHVRWTHVALDSDMTLTRSFASFFLSTRLRQFSAGALSHCVPRAGTPSAFYAGAARTLAEIQRVDPEYDVVEVQLQELVDLITPPLPEHYKKFDLSRHKPSWKLITASFLDARRASFMYRLARGCLPITYRPFTKNIQRGVCPFCQSREDLAHIFCECALPKALLRKVADLFKLPGIPFPTVRYLNPLPSHAVNQFVLLLVECLYQVWLARCEAVHGGRVLGLHEVLAKVRKEVWFHLFRERYRLGAKKFLEDWHRPAVIYSESRGQLTIQL